MIYDIIIIGAGPAGITAGIYAARREMKTLIIGKEIGGQVMWASIVENYPGFKSIESFELINKMREHVESFGVKIKNKEVQKITKEKDGLFLAYVEKEVFKAKTMIIAMGLSPRRLAIPGERELNGKGVTYCANCDAPFYRNRRVAVVGGGNSALDAAEVLSKIAKQVFLIHRRREFRAFEALIKEVEGRKNIELLLDCQVSEIIGKDRLEKVKIFNTKTKKEKELKLDGIFIEIGRIAHTDLVGELVQRDERDQIIIDNQGKTKTPGLFACGDVTSCQFKQISVAIGSATIAALSAYQYLQLREGRGGEIVLDRSPVKPK